MNIYEPDSFNLETRDWDIFSTWIKGVLITHTPTITFIKRDGSERVMRCSLRPDLLPPVVLNEDRVPRKKAEGIISVYDVDANGWRSFDIRSVKRVEFPFDTEDEQC